MKPAETDPGSLPQGGERFAWPPRPMSGVPDVHRTSAGRVEAHLAHSPGMESVDVTPVRPARIDPPRFPKYQEALKDIETVWLGQTRAPFAERAREDGWVPDGAGAYCPRCGVSCGSHEALDPDELGDGVPVDDAGCPSCRGRRLSWHRLIRLGEYNGLLREVILETKFSRWRRLGYDVGRVLGEQFKPYLQRERIDPERAVLVPVPTPFWRRLWRGIDHTLALCRGVRDASGVGIRPLLRRRGGPSQVSVMPSQRLHNVRGTMRSKRQAGAVDGLQIIVIDDVKTTGATLTEACRALRAGWGAGGDAVRIWAAVVAVAGDD